MEFMRMGRVIGCAVILALAVCLAQAAEGPALVDVAYKSGAGLSDYEKERCKLDVYLPQGKGFATLVWFHGGGLTAGRKDDKATRGIAQSLARGGIGVVVPNYRLSPKAKYPAYIEDAAAAVAWAYAHIGERGGDAKKIFIGGHSAGGYLTLMLGLDGRYLEKAGVDLKTVAGLIPVSGQVMTHYTVREERGIGKYTITADEAAPVYYARAETAPMLVIYADHDMPARAEENAYLVAILKAAGNKQVEGIMMRGRDHGSVGNKMAEAGDPVRAVVLAFIKKYGAK